MQVFRIIHWNCLFDKRQEALKDSHTTCEKRIEDDEMKSIAIVTVIYNAEIEIVKTVESVLMQKCFHLSYYIMDGKSTDNTLQILSKYNDLFRNKGFTYKVVSQRDSGIFDAMNASLDLIDEDYVLFLNAGDFLYDENVIRHIEFFLEHNECDICYGDYYVYYGTRRKKYISYEPDFLLKGMMTTHQAIFTKTELLKKSGYSGEYKMAADYDFYLRMYLEEKKFIHINEFVVYFQIGGVSQLRARMTQNEVVRIKRSSLNLDDDSIRRLKRKVPFICLKKIFVACLPDRIRYKDYESF